MNERPNTPMQAIKKALAMGHEARLAVEAQVPPLAMVDPNEVRPDQLDVVAELLRTIVSTQSVMLAAIEALSDQVDAVSSR